MFVLYFEPVAANFFSFRQQWLFEFCKQATVFVLAHTVALAALQPVVAVPMCQYHPPTLLFTCGEAAGPRKARVVVVVVVGGPNRVVYLIANQSLTHYKFSSEWDPILQFIQPNFLTINSLRGGIRLSQIRFLFGVGSSANRSDFLKRSFSP